MVALLWAGALASTSPQAAKPAHSKTKTSKATTQASDVNLARRMFVGTWRLVSSVETLGDGTTRPYGFGPHATGYLMYDATGHVCAQVVNPDRPKWRNPEHPTGDEVLTAFEGFGGYCGTYTIDTAKGTVAHFPEVPFDPNIVGKPSPRNFRFDGGRLIYTGTEKNDQGETKWEMVWEKLE